MLLYTGKIWVCFIFAPFTLVQIWQNCLQVYKGENKIIQAK